MSSNGWRKMRRAARIQRMADTPSIAAKDTIVAREVGGEMVLLDLEAGSCALRVKILLENLYRNVALHGALLPRFPDFPEASFAAGFDENEGTEIRSSYEDDARLRALLFGELLYQQWWSQGHASRAFVHKTKTRFEAQWHAGVSARLDDSLCTTRDRIELDGEFLPVRLR